MNTIRRVKKAIIMMVAARRKTSRGERNPWMRGENWLAEKKGDKRSGGERIEGPVSL